MIVATHTRPYTPADLLVMPDGNRYELIDGELVEQNVSTWSSFVAGKVYVRLQCFCEGRSLGWVFPEGTSYQCFPHAPERVRRAAASFIQGGRLTGSVAAEAGHTLIAPDLAVEVVSPGDLAYEVDAKVQDYLRAGVRLVWVVNPQVRTVEVHRTHSAGLILREQDELDGEDVLPDFRCKVGDFFQLPPGVTP